MPQVDRIFGNEGEADVTARIVNTYGHDPGAKYSPENQPGGETETARPDEQDRARGRPWTPTALDVKLNRGSALMFFAGSFFLKSWVCPSRT